MKNSSETIRPHVVDIIGGMRKYVILLLIPLIRGLLMAGGSFHAWVIGAWLDISTLFVVLLLGFIRWRTSKITISQGCVKYERGIFLRSSDTYSDKNITALKISQPFSMRLLGAYIIKPCTAGCSQRELWPLFVNSGSVEKIADALISDYGNHITAGTDSFPSYEYKPDYKNVALISAASSNIVGGLAFFFALIGNLGRVLGENLAGKLSGSLETIASFFALKIPSAVIIWVISLFVLYTLAFMRSIGTYYKLIVLRKGRYFDVSGGLFGKYRYLLPVENITSADLRYKLWIKPFRRCSVTVNTVGYGGKTFMPIIIPSCPVEHSTAVLEKLLPEYRVVPFTVYTVKGFASRRFALPPFILAGCLACTALIGLFLLPDFKMLFVFWGSIITLWLIWVGTNKLVSARYSSLGIKGCYVHAAYEKRRTFHSVFLPIDKISAVTISRSRAQRRAGLCTVSIQEYSDHKIRHIVRHVPLKKIRNAFESSDFAELLIKE